MAEVLNKSEIAELGREGSTKRIGRPSGKSLNFDRSLRSGIDAPTELPGQRKVGLGD